MQAFVPTSFKKEAETQIHEWRPYSPGRELRYVHEVSNFDIYI